MIELLKDLLNLNIDSINIEKSIKLKSISEYQFWAHKATIVLSDGKKLNTFFKFIEKDKIKESLYCYWNLVLEQKQDINKNKKVSIVEQEKEMYKSTIYLETEEVGLSECKAKVYIIDIQKYLQKCLNNIEQALIENKFLFIGVVS